MIAARDMAFKQGAQRFLSQHEHSAGEARRWTARTMIPEQSPIQLIRFKSIDASSSLPNARSRSCLVPLEAQHPAAIRRL